MLSEFNTVPHLYRSIADQIMDASSALADDGPVDSELHLLTRLQRLIDLQIALCVGEYTGKVYDRLPDR